MKDTPAPEELDHLAASALRHAEAADLRIATAESCTGGLLSALLTDIEGLSHVFERGFVVYAEEAKAELLGLDRQKLSQEGAVSEWAARAMVLGALEHSRADIAVAITGFAGPGEGEEGLVHIAAACRTEPHPVIRHFERRYGPVGRADIRARAAADAILLLSRVIASRIDSKQVAADY
jgi:nicotinamide-nucleotide amidase